MANLQTEIKYARILGQQLDHFKLLRSNPYLSNFRCVICGDSEYNKNKTRAYIIERKGSLFYFCHNCSASLPLWKLLKEKYYALYEQLHMEEFEEWGLGNHNRRDDAEREFIPERMPVHKVVVDNTEWLRGLINVTDLPDNHPAMQYIIKRHIPESVRGLLYYAANFGVWGSKHFPDKITLKANEPRLVIPILDKDGVPIGCSARALTAIEPRYYTLFNSDDHIKIFGLDRVDIARPYIVTEGAIDSLFIANAIAMMGTSVNLHQLPIPVGVENAVFAYDNEQRNLDVINNMIRKVKDGYRIVVFPSTIKEKDINEMVLAGVLPSDPEKVLQWLLKNSYQGLSALAKISTWRIRHKHER